MQTRKRTKEPAAEGSGKLRGLYFRKDRNRWYFARQRNGVRVPVNLETDDYRTAYDRAIEIAARPELQRSDSIRTEVENYIRERQGDSTKRPLREATVRWTRDVAKAFVDRVGDLDVQSVSLEICRDFHALVSAERKTITANQYCNALRPVFGYLQKKGKIRSNPFAFPLPKVSSPARLRWVSWKDYTQLIAKAEGDDSLQFILFCGFHAGMRVREIDNARAEWFDIPGKVVRIVPSEDGSFGLKDHSPFRVVPLTDEFLAFLARYGKKEPYMLRPDVKKGKWRYRYDFRKPFGDFMRRHGKGWVTPHVMRHSFASFNAQMDVSLFKISEWLGDEVETVVRHYAHLCPDDRTIELAQQRAREKWKQ